jgi:hypothetical protein
MLCCFRFEGALLPGAAGKGKPWTGRVSSAILGAGEGCGMGDVARLMRWNAKGGQPPEAFARLQNDPDFPHALRALARNMIEAGERDKALDGIFKDAGRYVAAMCAAYLHASGGLTLPRLKELCASLGILSMGRARALLLYLRYLNYVRPLPQTHGEPQIYVPTDAFVQTWRGHMRAALGSIQIFEPAVEDLIGALDDTDVLNHFSKLHSDNLFASARSTDQNMAFFRVFMQRYAGSQIVWMILLADKDCPPSGPVAFSVSAAARKFNVSRMHIKRLLNDAEREGLIRLEGGGTLALTAKGHEQLVFVYSSQFLCLLDAAARTVRDKAVREDRTRTQAPMVTSEPAPHRIISESIPA